MLKRTKVCLSTVQAHTCAITSKGTLYMWGGHREGQLGLGRPTYVSLDLVLDLPSSRFLKSYDRVLCF